MCIAAARVEELAVGAPSPSRPSRQRLKQSSHSFLADNRDARRKNTIWEFVIESLLTLELVYLFLWGLYILYCPCALYYYLTIISQIVAIVNYLSTIYLIFDITTITGATTFPFRPPPKNFRFRAKGNFFGLTPVFGPFGPFPG